MLARLGCLFVVVPLIELALLIWLGQWMGVMPTVLLVAVTGVLGAWLARTQGVQALTRLQEEMARGELPGKALMDGAAILVGGTLLLTPGVLTDVLGFALLIPPTRSLLQKWALAGLKRRVEAGSIHFTMMSGGFPGPGKGRLDDRDPESGDDDDRPPPPRPGEIVQ